MGCGPASRPAPPRGPAGIGSPAPAAGNERESGRPIRNDPPHALVVRRDVRGIRRRPSKRFMQIAVEEARTNASEGKRRGRLGSGPRREPHRPRTEPGRDAGRPHPMRRRWPCATQGRQRATPTSPGARSTLPSSPARMCCGAILPSGVSTLVMRLESNGTSASRSATPSPPPRVLVRALYPLDRRAPLRRTLRRRTPRVHRSGDLRAAPLRRHPSFARFSADPRNPSPRRGTTVIS